ncbi:hypothetical protein NK8_73880 (plasmid) [Caballeronia sp. NK8]|nr:hypothetical protein NK8_73880 [Caballeronia sp. NK8]
MDRRWPRQRWRQEIDAASRRRDGVIEAIQVGEFGDVRLHGTDISTYRGDSRVQLRLASPRDEDSRSLGGKALGGRQADPNCRL